MVRGRVAGHWRIAVAAMAVLALIGVGVVLTTGRSSPRVTGAVPAAATTAEKGQEVNLDPTAIAKARARAGSGVLQTGSGGHRPQLVVAVAPGMADDQPAPTTSHSSAHAPSDAEIERDLQQFRKYLATVPPTPSDRAAVTSSGDAAAPFNAPQVVIAVVEAANQIAKPPYRWGGGHGAWRDKGYDCSGSVSFALAGAGLLNTPLDSTRFMNYGAPGPGKWITIYANASHAFMTIAGLRFDTGGLSSG